MGTMNVYMGGSAKLAAALAQEGALPRWLAGDAHRSIPRRPLLVLAFTGTLVLLALGAGFSNAADLVRATSACFVAVYLASLASAVRILGGRIRVAAIVSLALVAVVALFSELFLLVPLGAALVALGARRVSRRRARERAQPHPA
jgi:amino acid efflux transporter